MHWGLSTILTASIKSVWSNVFWYVKVYVFWKFIQYTIHGDKREMLKKFPSDKRNVTKNVAFFLSCAPTHHGFTFNLQFLYELKHKFHLSKTVWDFPLSIPSYSGVEITLGHRTRLNGFATWLVINFPNFKLFPVIMWRKNWKRCIFTR